MLHKLEDSRAVTWAEDYKSITGRGCLGHILVLSRKLLDSTVNLKDFYYLLFFDVTS